MPVFSEEKLLHVPGAQIFMPGVLVFAAATQKTSLDLMALEASGACIPWNCNNQAAPRPPRVLIYNKLKHTHSLSVKEAYVLGLMGGLQVWRRSRGI